MIFHDNSGSVNADRFELLCKDGVRRPLSEYRQCSWGLVPSHALVTSSARTTAERKHYQQFLTRAVQLYSSKPVQNITGAGGDRRYEGFNRFDKSGDDKYYDQNYLREQNNQNAFNPYGQYDNNANNNNQLGYRSNLDSGFSTERSRIDDNTTQSYEKFELFESERYGGRLNLMFQDAARGLLPIKEDEQSFGGYLGGAALQQILEVRQCPVGRMTLCVTSDAEMDKCIKMRVRLMNLFNSKHYQERKRGKIGTFPKQNQSTFFIR